MDGKRVSPEEQLCREESAAVPRAHGRPPSGTEWQSFQGNSTRTTNKKSENSVFVRANIFFVCGITKAHSRNDVADRTKLAETAKAERRRLTQNPTRTKCPFRWQHRNGATEKNLRGKLESSTSSAAFSASSAVPGDSGRRAQLGQQLIS